MFLKKQGGEASKSVAVLKSSHREVLTLAAPKMASGGNDEMT